MFHLQLIQQIPEFYILTCDTNSYSPKIFVLPVGLVGEDLLHCSVGDGTGGRSEQTPAAKHRPKESGQISDCIVNL